MMFRLIFAFRIVVAMLIAAAPVVAQQADTTDVAPTPYFSLTSEDAAPAGEPEATGEEGEQPPTDGQGFPIPVGFSGTAELVTDGYAARGINDRRPNALWRLAVSPRFTIFREITVSADLLVTQEQTRFQQDMGQIGLNPTWRWVTLHLGDFNRAYSPLTLQGIRIRGAGVDLEPGNFRFSVQGGRVQRRTTTIGGEPSFRRNLLAFLMGYGAPTRSYLNLTAVAARDEFSAEDVAVIDTILVDTIPEPLRPRIATRPMEGVTAGVEGQIVLFEGAFRLQGEAATALTNSDRTSPQLDVGDGQLPVSETIVDMFGDVVPIRYSSSFDYAYTADASLRLGPARVNGGYEFVGGGYNSLGLPYLVADRQGYDFGGGLALLQNRVSLRARYQHRANNVLSQQLATVDRNSISTSATMRLSDRLTTVLTGFITEVGSDAPDSLRLDTRSWSANGNVMLQQPMFGLETAVNLGYNLQQTSDGRAAATVPEVTTHNIQGSIDVPVTERISLAPSLSGVLTRADGQPSTTNVFLGFRGSGRFLDEGRLRTSASLSHTVSQGRRIVNGNANVTYPVLWDTELVFQLRHNEFSAFGDRPAFGESFATLALRRTF